MGKGESEGKTEKNDLPEFQQGCFSKFGSRTGTYKLEHQYRYKGTDRINKNSFPFKNGRNILLQGNIPQYGRYHRGSRYNDQCCE